MTIHRTIYDKAVFYDTGAFIAISNPNDAHHRRAILCEREIKESKLPIYVSNITIAETHKRMLFDLGYSFALSFLCKVYAGCFNILRIVEVDEKEAKRIIKSFSDQKFTFADAANFSLMKRYGIGKAFAFDEHYNVFGFEKIPSLIL